MKQLPVYLILLQSCLVHAGQYSVSRVTAGHVYDEDGKEKDACAMHGEMMFTLTDGGRISADPRTMRLHADNGSSVLSLEPEVLSLFSHDPQVLGKTPATQVDLTDRKAINWNIGDQKGESTSWTRVESQLLEECRSKKLDLAAIIPATWLLSRIPFVLHVDERLKVGDDVDIPFRKPFDPNHVSTTDRTGRLTCISKNDGVAILASSRTIEKEAMSITWHVRVEYDMKKQRLVRVVEENFIKLRPPMGRETHTTYDALQCQLQES